MLLDIIDNSFDYPSNLSSLSFEEKEDLRIRHLRQNAISGPKDSCELNPARVIDTHSAVFQIEQEERRNRERIAREEYARPTALIDKWGYGLGRYVDGIGYVVNDLVNALSRNIPKEERKKIKNEVFEKQEIAERRAKYARMSDVEKDADDRYGDMI